MVEYPQHRRLLGQAIREQRKKMRLTQEQLGELADLSPKYLGDVERAVKTISVDALVRVATALGVSLRELVKDF